jgi:hypothetical protein
VIPSLFYFGFEILLDDYYSACTLQLPSKKI